MMIITNNQLNHRQLNELNTLIAVCQKIDDYTLPVYLHLLSQPRQKPCNFLLYQDNNLVGFATLFFFYETACEVALMVAPAYRRQGWAKKMIKRMLPLAEAERIQMFFFSAVHGERFTWLKELHLQYHESEFEMARKSLQKITIPQKKLTYRHAVDSDIALLSAIDKVCFPDAPEPIDSRYAILLNQDEYSLILACLNNIAMGKAHIHWHSAGARLSDIAILPDFQKKGFGRELISYCINHALQLHKPNLSLDVHSKNKNAIKLYSNLDFKIINVCDYWKIPVCKLRLILE